jgi:Flp pilus assembly secretin CpaC
MPEQPMRRSILSLTLALAALAGAAQAAPSLVVPIDQSTPLTLPRGARDVLIGNPAIADVAVIDAGKAVVSGRGYGVTNLVVIDQLGRTVLERQVVVAAPSQGRVSVIRGPKVSEYACAGGCERSGGDGDSAKP